MDSPTQLKTVNKPSGTGRERAAPDAPDAVFSALVQTETLEFISSMQLLAERARFLSGADGVAIALKQDGRFVYCVSAGNAAEVATTADVHKAPVANCLASAKPSMLAANTSRGQLVRAAVPIMRQGEVAGFFELSAPRSSFSNEDLLAVSGLAEIVNTALDHKQAVENARKQMLDFAMAAKSGNVTPIAWHAAPQPEAQPDSPTAVPEPLKVQTCQSCGFPVSEGRQLCVDCERNPNTARAQVLPLLEPEKEESWISTHGYTIASVLVTALVAAIIFWLR
jgi:GAF domain-containing protein